MSTRLGWHKCTRSGFLHDPIQSKPNFFWIASGRVFFPPLPKTIDSIFISYAHDSSAYWFLLYEWNILDIHKNLIIELRNASVSEHVFPYKLKNDSTSIKWTDEDINEDNEDHEQEVFQDSDQ